MLKKLPRRRSLEINESLSCCMLMRDHPSAYPFRYYNLIVHVSFVQIFPQIDLHVP